MGLVAGIGAALDPQSLAALTAAAQIEFENNQGAMAPPRVFVAPPRGSIGSVLGTADGFPGLGQQKPLSPNEVIAQQLQGAWRVLSDVSAYGAQALGNLMWGGWFSDPLPGYGDANPIEPPGPFTTPIADETSIATPGRPGLWLPPISVPGQINNGPQGGETTATPLENSSGPTLIYQDGGGTSTSALQEVRGLFSSKAPGSIQLGESTFTELPNSGNAAVFSGATDEQVAKYFLRLSGASSLPPPVPLTIRGTTGVRYTIETPFGNFTLRNVSSSESQTGPVWTIDIPRDAIGTSASKEIKFLMRGPNEHQSPR
ncbi:hypothetical protein BOSP111201_04000 [Bordetella sputigena]